MTRIRSARKTLFAGALLLSLMVGASYVGAQTNGSEWTKLAGNLQANVSSIAPDPANGQTVYALSPDGISRSTDGGASWAQCKQEARYMRLVAPLPGQGGSSTLYAATPLGLSESSDGCLTWKDVSAQGINPSSGHVRWLNPYPNNPQVLYAGMDGLGGLYRSTDGGATWQAASKGLPGGAWVTALTADPQRPSRVLIGLRYPDRAHPPAYIFVSEDGGLSWRSSSLGMSLLANNDGRITGLAWSGSTLIAATASDGLYASADGGRSWQPAVMPRRGGEQQPSITPGAPAARPLPLAITDLRATLGGTLLLVTEEGTFRSADGAQSWQRFGPAAAAPGNLLGLDVSSGRVVLADDSGLWTYSMPAEPPPLPTPTRQPTGTASPTAPPPAMLPTNTPAPTSTPTLTPTPTIPVVQGPLPSDRAQPLDPSIASYFPQTGHNIKYGFRDFWINNGGLGMFGYPLTEEFVENGVTVQYFERVRFEYRGGKVQLGRLGAELTSGQFFRPVNFFPSTDTNVYFGPTGHSVSGPFLKFWSDNGGLSTFGFPLSESFKADGSEYQWFERARFEWHSNLPENQRIVLGNIGTEELKKRGWLR